MSSRQKKAKSEEKTEPKKNAGPERPTGKVPAAAVTVRHGTGLVSRPGRGFSRGELAAVGLAPGLASRWGVMVDSRRRSVLDANVSSLKAWGVHPSVTRKVEGRAKEIEEEVKKLGREVKKEAVKVEKEATKVEREVKAEASKAEKGAKRGAVKVEKEAKGEAAKVEKAVRRRAKPKKKEDS